MTSSTGEHVLRGNPHYPGQFQAEHFYTRALSQGTRVPVPWPYRIDTGTGIFGWSYAVMPRMPGLHLSDPEVRDRLEPAQRMEVARALGENLAEMHALTWDHPGRYHPAAQAVVPLEPADASAWALPDPARTYPGPSEYGRWAADRVQARLATACAHDRGATTSADLAWAGSVMAAGAPAIAVPFQPRLVMEDYKEGNLVVVHDGGRWTVGGVFDLAQSYFGDAESDLPRTLCSYLDEGPEPARAFLTAYLARRPPRPGFPQRAAAYLLLDRALLWEFFQRRGLRWWPEAWTFRDWAGRYLDLMRSTCL
ncbi:phosphotransferase family protein [Spirillospora sp. NBC_01491]|uniref:phosphotransferase family protein n=1 Tax=Spirillospora sp. NBC_01491 TaxID=2976007 RepID=UPI002E34A673|nr:phosphotransferase [Spirillospora sp. NBC_01491]